MAPTLRQTSRASKTAAAAAAAAIERPTDHNHDEDSMDVDVDVEPQVKLKSSDGKRFTLTKAEASCSSTLRMMIESSRTGPSASAEVISLQSVHSDMLSKVVSWCQMHRCNEIGEDSLLNTDATSERYSEPDEPTDWDKAFISSLSEVDLFRLTHVANYLNVKSLLNTCCRTIAKSWEAKKVEEIRKMYQIENDFPPEEEHQMLMESKRLGMDN